jgi:hypothetical protein
MGLARDATSSKYLLETNRKHVHIKVLEYNLENIKDMGLILFNEGISISTTSLFVMKQHSIGCVWPCLSYHRSLKCIQGKSGKEEKKKERQRMMKRKMILQPQLASQQRLVESRKMKRNLPPSCIGG